MSLLRLLAAFALLIIAAPAAADTVASASSPAGTLKIDISLNGEGRIGYSISRIRQPVIGESHLGFLLSDAPQLLRNFQLVAQQKRSVDDTWEQPWGEWRKVRDHYNEIALTFEEKSKLKRRMTIVFRVFDDGVGFRYELPAQPSLSRANIVEELTQFDIVEPGTAWWAPAFESNREEYLYNRTPIDGVGIAQTPFTMRTASGLHIAIHEAALVDYSGMNVARVQGGDFKAMLTPSSSGPKVVRDTPFETPWRVILITPDGPSLYAANQLILNLNEPNKLGDVSWVRPRKYVGIWWGMHLDTQSWALGPKHGATTAYAKKMIDFAAKNGFTGLLAEGWNKGWDDDWFATGNDFSFTQAYPDFDIRAVSAYGLKKGVHLIGHHETSGNIAHYEEQLGAALDLDRELGIDTVKTGYVSDAGGIQARGDDGKIHFEWHEGQVMARHHLHVVTEAAKRHVAINPHEPIKDTGLRRTYPNWVSREGQRGMEYSAWGVPKNPPEHEANLIFTRMLGGPMDYTPGVLSLTGRGNTPILSTLAKQLALYVVLYSPIQMAADLPENYDANPGPFQFIKDVAVDWDDTRMLAGKVGDLAVIVRKQRGRPDWFLGAVGDEQERRFDVPLSFLDPGRRYRAEIYRDGDTADYRTNPRAIVIERRTVTASDRMALRIAPGGGAAVRFVAVGK
ncbi:MAG: glycoside hydrolase family 97 protein [Sphingomonas sp.]|nr:glycoside hydrolase family 97 protein [Sphingomonas sp.]